MGGLAALAAVLLLLFLKKRRKKKTGDEAQETGADLVIETFTEDEPCISEYGLSEGCDPGEDGEDQEDLPQAGSDVGHWNSDLGNASEHNPEDIDEGILDADES
jgi:hypothetical protein